MIEAGELNPQTLLKKLAQAKGISVNKLIEELSTIALAEFEAMS
ncbi:hypothetical protein [Nostoc sp. NMS4]|nr:hypothetical protein [Nostoc sp. NMS4]